MRGRDRRATKLVGGVDKLEALAGDGAQLWVTRCCVSPTFDQTTSAVIAGKSGRLFKKRNLLGMVTGDGKGLTKKYLWSVINLAYLFANCILYPQTLSF